jgi:FlaA1/EpsC-like NDP-sugar epimerase
MDFTNKVILITGGTGSLGKHIVKRLMSGDNGKFKKIIIFSRDEDKHYQMSLDWSGCKDLLKFRVGDVRDYTSVLSAMRDVNIVIHAAAMKQVPLCEYFPLESIKTNIYGIVNITRAIKENNIPVETVLVVSTDKACQPVNTYGMCKAIQERIAIESNISIEKSVKVIVVRYGNVMASRGSIIPLFQKQILEKREITVTSRKMSRFMMSIDESVDTIFNAINKANPGEIYVPKIPAAKIGDIVEIMTEGRSVEIKNIGIRPGEKINESLISMEESIRTLEEGDYFVITPFFPELECRKYKRQKASVISSDNFILSKYNLKNLLRQEGHLNF